MNTLWILALAACAPTESEAADSAADSGEPASELLPPDSSGALTLTDANNYSFTGLLDGPTLPAAELADVEVSWSALTDDLQCHGLDPVQDIDNTALLVFPYLSEEEVEAGLSADSIEQSDLGVYLSYEPGDATSLQLSDFTFFGTEANIQNEFEEGSGTWLVLLTTGDTLGVGSRMIAFLDPTPGETASKVEIQGGCSVLDYTADLSSLTPLSALPAGPWLADWSGLTADGRGGELSLGSIDGVMVGRYPDHTPADLEVDFLDLEQNAETLWTMELDGEYSADLSLLTDSEGSPFPGFDSDASWILALRCSTCTNPAPPFLTVLVPWEE